MATDVTRLLSTGEVSRILNISPATVYRMAKQGKLFAILLGGYRYYDPEQIAKLKAEREAESR